MRGGAFLISREIFDNPLWSDPLKFRIFFYILGHAVFSKDGAIVAGVKLERGQFLISLRNLQKEIAYREGRGGAIVIPPYETVRRKLKELVNEGRLSIEKTNFGSLITVLNYDKYQALDSYRNKEMGQQWVGNESAMGQQWVNNNNDNNDLISDINITNDINNVRDSENESPKDESPEKEKSKTYKYDERQMMLAKLLFKKIRENNPKAKEPNMESWANTFRLMMERDGREGKEIQNVILWSQQDSFWYKNILSADKLRKQFDRLYLQMQDELKKRGGLRSEIDSGDVGESRKPKYDFSRRKIL